MEPLQQYLAAALEQLRSRSGEFLGGDHALLKIHSTISRPYSAVARVQYTHANGDGVVFAKAFRPRSSAPGELALMGLRVERDFAATNRIYALMRDRQEIAVPRPVACFPNLLTVVTEEAPGVSLLARIEDTARWKRHLEDVRHVAPAFARTGKWLRVFQSMGAGDQRLTIEEVEDYIDVRLQRLVAHPGTTFNEEDRMGVISALRGLWADVSEGDRIAVPVHADLAMGNILVHDDRVTVLDFAMTTNGCRYHDVAHLFMQLDLLTAKPMFRPGVVRFLQDELLTGFAEDASRAAPLFRIMLLQHVACHLSGLLHRPAGRLERLYNRYVARRHLRWLRAFATDGSGALVRAQTAVA